MGVLIFQVINTAPNVKEMFDPTTIMWQFSEQFLNYTVVQKVSPHTL